MIVKRILVFFGCILAMSLGLEAQEAPPNAHIAALKDLVDFPMNDCDAVPIYCEIGDQVAAGTHSGDDLKMGRANPSLYMQAVECGQFLAPVKDPFKVEQGQVVLDFSLDLGMQHILPHLHWVRGLQKRVDAAVAEDRSDDAWREIRRVFIVGLHFYESKSVLIDHLIGMAMLRLAAQQAMRSELPEVAQNRALLTTIVDVCQSERVRVDELVRSVEPRATYLRFAGRDEKKVIYDFITVMKRLIEHKDHALGGEIFFMAVAYVATAANDQCWEIFFACLPRLENTENRWIQKTLGGLFKSYEKREIRQMLEEAYLYVPGEWFVR